MHTYELLAVVCYFTILLTVGFFSYRRHLSASEFMIGGRSLNYWLTALAAHASDMSSWLFLGYPAVIFSRGMIEAWAAVGLIAFMYLNWQFIAPKIRVATEQFNSLTFSSFFESRLADRSGTIRVFTACMSLIFYTIYISSGLVGLGLLLETLFGLHYSAGILIGILIVVPYVFTGGYVTLAWIDLFQGFFLMLVILFVPFYILPKMGGWSGVTAAASLKGISLSLFPHGIKTDLWAVFAMVSSWGLGYFGQPHIVTKFMGIRNVGEMAKSKWIGMSWMVVSLSAATVVGLVAIPFFQGETIDPQEVFIQMVQQSFSPFLIGLILCGVLAATINAMSSMVLVLSSSLTEDFYKRVFRSEASSKELLTVSRIGVLLVAAIAFAIAYFQLSTIYSLVYYSWTGLGCSFGPLMIHCLYSRQVNKYGAWVGILSGGIIAGFWPYFNKIWGLEIPAMLPGFAISLFLIWAVSHLTRKIATHSFTED